jgi:signal transduction histidine kinase
VLQAPGIELLTARSGAEALELLLLHDVAVALIDVQMPTMDGFELAELMRGHSRTRQVPIIFLTAGDRNQRWMFRGYESGAVDFLYKPIDGRLLQSKVSVFVELHERRRELAQQVEKLHEMLEVSDRFIGVLGHDLRNPASAISMATEILLNQENDPQKADMLRRINRANLRMNRLVTQLLDFARARLGGGIPVKPTAVDLGELARAAVREFSLAGAKIHIEERGDLRASLDADRMGQLLSNLLGNAHIHGTPGATIDLGVDGSQAGHVTMTVHNQGHIPEPILARLFTPGPYGEESARLGLGLYIVDQIVRAHGGTITCRSIATEGTTFHVTLPRARGAEFFSPEGPSAPRLGNAT